jgi:hypothetical protein
MHIARVDPHLKAFGAYDLKVKSAVVWPGVSIVPELHAGQWSRPDVWVTVPYMS